MKIVLAILVSLISSYTTINALTTTTAASAKPVKTERIYVKNNTYKPIYVGVYQQKGNSATRFGAITTIESNSQMPVDRPTRAPGVDRNLYFSTLITDLPKKLDDSSLIFNRWFRGIGNTQVSTGGTATIILQNFKAINLVDAQGRKGVKTYLTTTEIRPSIHD
jgi:hypothetical protein